MIQHGVQELLLLLEEQMGFDQNQEAHRWEPRYMGITIFQTFVNAPVLKSSIWRASQAVGDHFLENRIVYRSPGRSHSGWQFFMTGPGDITHPHIDPPLVRSLFWQVIGSKLWCIWPPTKENLALFEQTVARDRTWQWAMENLHEPGRKCFIMEPGTWWVLNPCEIHACISLSPSVHASQEFFDAQDAEQILRIWRDTENARARRPALAADELPEELAQWLPEPFQETGGLETLVENAIELYNYGRQMVMTGKSDEVTLAPELYNMLPLVRDWIEKAATHVRHQ